MDWSITLSGSSPDDQDVVTLDEAKTLPVVTAAEGLVASLTKDGSTVERATVDSGHFRGGSVNLLAVAAVEEPIVAETEAEAETSPEELPQLDPE